MAAFKSRNVRLNAIVPAKQWKYHILIGVANKLFLWHIHFTLRKTKSAFAIWNHVFLWYDFPGPIADVRFKPNGIAKFVSQRQNREN